MGWNSYAIVLCVLVKGISCASMIHRARGILRNRKSTRLRGRPRTQANSVKGHRTGSLALELACEILALQVMDANELGPPENRRVEPRQ
jgi:hypothetical protein